MTQSKSADIEELVRHLERLPPVGDMPLAEARKFYDRAEKVFPLPPGTEVVPVETPGGPGELIRPGTVGAGALILYVHGGGYVLGSPKSHRHLASALGAAANAEVLLLDFRRAPEHPFPAALEDVVRAYAWSIESRDPARIAFVGDSAGGGLALAALVALRDADRPMPAAAVCLSPWLDLTCTLRRSTLRTIRDPLVRRQDLIGWAEMYLRSSPPTTPLASPIYADLASLPPLLIQVSAQEWLFDDARRLCDAAQAAGVKVEFEAEPDVPHVWQWFWPRLAAGREAVSRIGAFLSKHLDRVPPS